jgi:hypothetical protein
VTRCPLHKSPMQIETGLAAHDPSRREYRYRCEECDAEYIRDFHTKKLRMIDGRDFDSTEAELGEET